MRKFTTVVLTLGCLVAAAGPAAAHHPHFVHIEATNTCQVVAHGQTSIDDADHGGHHRFHDNVHMGRPGTKSQGNAIDKTGNLGLEQYDGCELRGAR